MKSKQIPSQTWTKKYDEFCLQHGLKSDATKLFWRWLLRQGQLGEEIEIDLLDFDKWVAKIRGLSFDPRTLKSALNRLIDLRIIRVVYEFRKWSQFKIIVRPLEWLNPKKCAANKCDSPPPIAEKDASNPHDSDSKVSSSSNSNISQNQPKDEHKKQALKLCFDHGIYFNPDKPGEVVNYSLEDIELAIAIFYQRGGHKKIGNPTGFLVDCLRNTYFESKPSLFDRLCDFLDIKKTADIYGS